MCCLPRLISIVPCVHTYSPSFQQLPPMKEVNDTNCRSLAGFQEESLLPSLPRSPLPLSPWTTGPCHTTYCRGHWDPRDSGSPTGPVGHVRLPTQTEQRALAQEAVGVNHEGEVNFRKLTGKMRSALPIGLSVCEKI